MVAKIGEPKKYGYDFEFNSTQRVIVLHRRKTQIRSEIVRMWRESQCRWHEYMVNIRVEIHIHYKIIQSVDQSCPRCLFCEMFHSLGGSSEI